MPSIVFVYAATPAEDDELKYAVRCAEAFLPECPIVVCGDHPGPWYDHGFIECRRLLTHTAKKRIGHTIAGRWRKAVDSIVKLNAIIESKIVSDRFLWMYDDSFITRPTTFEDLAIPRHGNLINWRNFGSTKTWQEQRRRTFKSLSDLGYPTWDYSTHFPAVYEKSRLARTIQVFDCLKNPRCIESLYLNQWGDADRIPVGNALQYVMKTRTSVDIRPDSLVLNCGHGSWAYVRPCLESHLRRHGVAVG